jgi:putative acetyltransferase
MPAPNNSFKLTRLCRSVYYISFGRTPFPDMDIKLDSLTSPEILALLEEHLQSMHTISPPESVHALDLAALRRPEITFWTVWSGSELMGCGALKELDLFHGEVKSMRTAVAHRRIGVAQVLLRHILGVAMSRRYLRLSLETGSQDAFEPARRLYERFGFSYCPPFEGYHEDPNSVFMTKCLYYKHELPRSALTLRASRALPPGETLPSDSSREMGR